MSKGSVCPICSNEAHVQSAQKIFGKYISCKRCGNFTIESGLYDGAYMEPKIKSAIYYYLTQIATTDERVTYHFIGTNSKEIGTDNDGVKIVPKAYLLNLLPVSFSDRIDKVMKNLARYAGKIGETFVVDFSKPNDIEFYKTLLFVDSVDTERAQAELMEIFELLTEMDYLTVAQNSSTLSNIDVEYKFAVNGWLAIQDLETKRNTLAQGFIAMWFDACMKDARGSIEQAIVDCGYVPSIIDIKEHNNFIVPEIFHEIDKSKFVIADLSGHRGGVYYEAGYGEGQNKPVILCCKESDFKDCHFDVKQKNIIIWSSIEDLYEKLCKRIRATVGDYNG